LLRLLDSLSPQFATEELCKEIIAAPTKMKPARVGIVSASAKQSEVSKSESRPLFDNFLLLCSNSSGTARSAC
jgi:hypothetical protein